MNKTVLKKLIVGLLLVTFVFGIFAQSNDVNAASTTKKGRYFAYMFGKGYNRSTTANIKSISFKGSKVVVKGALYYGKDVKVYSSLDDYKLKDKKRTFKLSKKCKFYAGGGMDGINKLSKKKFIKVTKDYAKSGLGLFIFVNKKGQVYKMVVKS